MAEEALTIRQAASLLGVHTNTVRNRIKSGRYQADKVVTEHGETYLISRSELEGELLANNLVSTPPSQHASQPLPDVREAMQAMLEPFVRELGDVREDLGRERERRERAEERVAELEGELDTLREERESSQTVEGASEEVEPMSYAVEVHESAREATEAPEAADEQQGRGQQPHSATGVAQEGARRPWWRRMFRG